MRPEDRTLIQEALRRLGFLGPDDPLPTPHQTLSGAAGKSAVYFLAIPRGDDFQRLVVKLDEPERAAQEWAAIQELRRINTVPMAILPVGDNQPSDGLVVYQDTSAFSPCCSLFDLLKRQLRTNTGNCMAALQELWKTLDLFYRAAPGAARFAANGTMLRWADIFPKLAEAGAASAIRAVAESHGLRLDALHGASGFPDPLLNMESRLQQPTGSLMLSRVHGDLNLWNVLVGKDHSENVQSAFVIDLATSQRDWPTAFDFARIESELWHEVVSTFSGDGDELLQGMIAVRDTLEGRRPNPPEQAWQAALLRFISALRQHAIQNLRGNLQGYLLGDYASCLYFHHLRAITFKSVRDEPNRVRLALLGAALAERFLQDVEAGRYAKGAHTPLLSPLLSHENTVAVTKEHGAPNPARASATTASSKTATNISGGAHGPVFSGNFAGQVTINVAQPPQGEKPPSPPAGPTKPRVVSADPQTPPLHRLHQLPAPLADFTGRAEVLRSLMDCANARVAISGVRGLGGIGKTALATEVAHRLRDRYPDAQIFLELRGSRKDPVDPADALAQAIRAFHSEARLPEGVTELGELYRSVLDGKRVLVLLDDARDGAQVKPLLPPQGCFLLITSRTKFTLPGLREHDLDTLSEAESRDLLLGIAPRIGAHADALSKLCGGLPLALRVAGTALAEHPTLGVDAYLGRLREARGRLSEVEASLALSLDLLSPELQDRWSMLGVFPGDFDMKAATALWVCGQGEAETSADDLVRRSLVSWDAGRMRLHDLARVFAESRMGAPEQARERHALHYLALLRRADDLYQRGGQELLAGMALADLEWGNIIAGQAWSASSGEAGARLACDYPGVGAYVLNLRLHPVERIRWLEAAITAARLLKDRSAEGNHVGNLGLAYADLGQPEKAIAFYEQNLVIAREIGDRRGEGNALGNLGNAYAALGQTKKAIEFHEQHLVITREIGDRRGEGNALGNLGNAYADLGQPEKAIAFYEQQLAITRGIGDRRGEGAALGNLGNAYAALGQPEKAIGFYEQALVIQREIGDRLGEGNALGNLGNAFRNLGQAEKAIAFHEQRLVIARQIADRRGEGTALGSLGNAYAALGQPEKAIGFYEQALVIQREIGDRRGEAYASWNLGDEYAKAGDLRRAVELMQGCVDFEQEIGHPDAEKDAQLVQALRAQLG